MKKFAANVLAMVMIVLFSSTHTAYACECGCGCNEEEQQAVENEDIDSWENIMYETNNIYFPDHYFFFRDVYVEDLDEDDKKVIEMGTYSFLIELTEDNRLLIEFYPPGDMGSRLNSNEMEDSDVCVKKEEAIQLGTSDVYAWGYCHSFSELHTGEIYFQMLIDEEVSQEFILYETPWGWTFEPVYFEESLDI